MRRRPLRKISCHPFLKIFVNLVSSVCGFISTCINVSSLVTEPHYLGEDIIKNVFGPWGGGGGAGALRGMGWGSLGRKRKVKASSLLPRESAGRRARDKGPTGWSWPGGVTGASVCCYLFNDTRSSGSAVEGKLASLGTAR